MITNYNKYLIEKLTYNYLINKISNFYKFYTINNKFLKVNYIYKTKYDLLYTFELFFENSENNYKEISFITIDQKHEQIRVSENSFNKRITMNDLTKYPITYDIDIILDTIRKKLNSFYEDFQENLEYDFIANDGSYLEHQFIDIPVITYKSFVEFISNKVKNNHSLINDFIKQIYNNKEYDVMYKLFKDKIGYLIDSKDFDLI